MDSKRKNTNQEEMLFDDEEVQSLKEELMTVKRELAALRDRHRYTAQWLALLDTIQTYAPIGLAFVDREFKYVRINEELAKFTGIPATDHLGHTIEEILPDLWPNVEEYFQRAIAGESVVNVEVSSESAAYPNELRHWLVNYYPVFSNDTEVSGIGIIVLDITERKRVEESLRKSEARNSELAYYMQAVFDGLSAHIAILDSQGRIEFVNKAWRDFAENNPPLESDVYEGTDYLACCDNARGEEFDDAQKAAKGIRDVLSSRIESFFLEYPCHSPTTRRWFNMRVTRFPSETHGGVIIAHENITERKMAEEALQQNRNKLQVQHSEMQQALLPGQVLEYEGYIIAARFVSGTAGEQIGGDFYDVFMTEAGKIAVLIGDVAGKGVEAGALAAVTRSTVRAFAYELDSPGPALSHTNSVVCAQSFTNERFATVFLAIFDPETGKLYYSSGGQPPAMILRKDSRVELLSAGGVPIRVIDDFEYVSYKVEFTPGDKLVLYTDGISEAHNVAYMYDIDGIEKTLQHQPDSGPEELVDMLFCVASDVTEGALNDDAAVIVIQRKI